jgi:hypothetical protein
MKKHQEDNKDIFTVIYLEGADCVFVNYPFKGATVDPVVVTGAIM